MGSDPAFSCLDEGNIASFVAGTLESPALERAEAHVVSCTRCSGLVGHAGRRATNECSPIAGDTDFGTADVSAPLLAVGEIVAEKYRILGALGAGGMGQVFAARHLELGLRVAIKILRSSDPTGHARFLREAQTSARLRNDHIPRVFDIGRLPDGKAYIVMEYLVGEDFARRAARGPVEPDQAAAYVLQACVALAEAHAAGIVHRDIKPANLFLTMQTGAPPLVKVLDFGIAKAVAETWTTQTAGAMTTLSVATASTVLGSPEYMSPEQIRASSDVDARSDIWSLGVVLYQLIAGRTPFRAPTFAALSAAITRQVPRKLRDIRPEVPEGIEAVVARCLEKDPDRRFERIADLARALAPFASRDHAVLVPATYFLGSSARAPAGLVQPRRGRFVVVAGAISLLVFVAAVWRVSIRKSDAALGHSVASAEHMRPRERGGRPKVAYNCTGQPSVAPGLDPLVDDLEDGDIRIRTADHRQGEWMTQSDWGCAMLPPRAHPEAPGGNNPTRFAMHVGAESCTDWGFGLSIWLNRTEGNCAYDASAYDGVYFWARSGDQPVSAFFQAPTTAVATAELGGDGTCEPTCWDAHMALIDLTPVWKQYAFRWADLKQRGFGKEVPFDVKRLISLGFNTQEIPRVFREIWIDQVSFFKGTPPSSPFADDRP